LTRVLVVEDVSDIRQLVVYALEDEGYEVVEAVDGQAALDLISEQHPDVIILDMSMPVIDGWKFAELYRERYASRAPIIVLTAAHNAAKRAADIDADAYVPKPFTLGALLERVSAMAGRTG